jgi:hypothetical protein
MSIIKTIWQNKKRIDFDSSLKLEYGSHETIFIPSLGINQNFTISCFANFNPGVTANNKFVIYQIYKYTGASGYVGEFYIAVDQDTITVQRLNDIAGENDFFSYIPLFNLTNKWLHFLFTYYSPTETIYAYLNGIKVFDYTFTNIKPTFSGASYCTNNLGSGKEVKISNYLLINKFLDETEVAYIFRNGTIQSSLHQYVKFYQSFNFNKGQNCLLSEGLTSVNKLVTNAANAYPYARFFYSNELISSGVDGEFSFYFGSEGDESIRFDVIDGSALYLRLQISNITLELTSNMKTLYSNQVGNTITPIVSNAGRDLKYSIGRKGTVLYVKINDFVFWEFDPGTGNSTTLQMRIALLGGTFNTAACYNLSLDGVEVTQGTGTNAIYTFTTGENKSLGSITPYFLKGQEEEFNYSKSSSIPNSSNFLLSDYTETELGTTYENIQNRFLNNLILKNTQNSLVDFWEIAQRLSLKCGALTPIMSALTSPPDFSTGISIVIKAVLPHRNSAGRHDILNKDSNSTYIFGQGDGNHSITVAGIAALITSTHNDLSLKDPCELVVTVSNAGEMNIYVNSKPAKNSTGFVNPIIGTYVAPLNTTAFNIEAFNTFLGREGKFKDLYVYDKVLTAFEIADRNWLNYSPVIGYNMSIDPATSKLIDLTGNGGDATLLNFDHTDINKNISVIDYDSNMPPREKALIFNGSSQYLTVQNFAPISDKIHMIFAYTIDDPLGVLTNTRYLWFYGSVANNAYSFLSGDSTTSHRMRYRNLLSGVGENVSLQFDVGMNNVVPANTLNGILNLPLYTTSEIGVQSYLRARKNQTTSFTNTFSVLAAQAGISDLQIGARPGVGYFWGKMAYCAIFSGGIINKKEVEFLLNNSLLKNPPQQWFKTGDISLELFIDFNNPYDDAGILKFPDLSPNGHTIIANGYTDLTTLQSNLVDINSIR